MSMNPEKLARILEAALMAAGSSLSLQRLQELFEEDARPATGDIRKSLAQLQEECDGRGIELVEVASGYRYQARQDYAEWIARLWEERPARYTRALLETLSLIAYRQPITRTEIEQVRGVSVSSSIIKTLTEREWVRVVGHRDVPGKPALYATTKDFLDYFGLRSLDELPSLAELRDLDNLNPELQLESGSDGDKSAPADSAQIAAGDDSAGEKTSGEDTGDRQAADPGAPEPADLAGEDNGVAEAGPEASRAVQAESGAETSDLSEDDAPDDDYEANEVKTTSSVA